MDMAGFAIHLCELVKNPKARVGINIDGQRSQITHDDRSHS